MDTPLAQFIAQVENLGYLIAKLQEQGGGPSGGAQAFLFQPGGAAGGNVYTSWAALAGALAYRSGPKWILVDSSIASAQVPAGSYNVDQCTFLGKSVLTRSLLTFAPGATLTYNVMAVDWALELQSLNTTSAVVTLASGGETQIRGSSLIAGNASFPFFTTQAGNGHFIVCVTGTLGDGTNNCILVNGSQSVFTTMTGFSNLNANAVAGTGTLTILLDAGSNSNLPQPINSTGTVSMTSEGVLNFQQALATLQSAQTTVTIVTANISRNRSGKVRVHGQISATASTGMTVTFQLLRDAGAIGPALTQLAAAGAVAGGITWLDTLPDFATHTYTIEATASTGNLTQAASSGSIIAQEL
jgi:hypothetical protein